ncbi:MAG TPA: DUF4349 domain-containing protein [Trebonia sp.]|jgi:hypothetical protein
MRIKRAVPAVRRPQLAAAAVLLVITAVAAAGCSGSSSSSSADSGSVAVAPAPAAAGASAAASGGFAAGSSSSSSASSGSTASSTKLAPTGQQLIYTAQLSVRAASVATAVSRATSIVTAAGGYVSAEKASSGQGRPDQATATVTFKIPVAAYQATLASLSGTGLGTQLALSQQAQDVTQQVADTSSRVASDEAAIAQLRALLKQAGSVSALLSVQNQIDAQESDLEAMLAQQSSLNHETSYATLTLSLVGPKAVVVPSTKSSAPPGLWSGLAHGWHAFVVTIGWLLTALGAAAPFIIAVLVLAGLGWWARRRINGRRQRPAGEGGAAD